MYFIQGADQKQYGPVSTEQLRQWISENRLNRSSPCRAESDADWRTVGDYPEFADLFVSQVPSGFPPSAVPNASAATSASGAMDQVRAVAIAVMITGGLGILLSLVGLVMHFAGFNRDQPIPPGFPPEYRDMFESYIRFNQQFGWVFSALTLVTSFLTLFGGIRLISLRSYGLVLTGVILGMVPCFSGCCCVGLPIGIWALVVLLKPEVKSQFR